MADKLINTVVVGGGQAGLSMSYHLAKHDVEHVVLERARVGERWRSERWDSLRFQFPNRYLRLPGFDYDGEAPEAFADRKSVVRVIERYAQHIAAPLQCGVRVDAIERTSEETFVLHTSHRRIHAQNVVLATGPYQSTRIPPYAADLSVNIHQLPASSYTNAGALPPGGVLVVGSGGSGVQIAEDLIEAGRDTWLCVGRHRRIPRRYRGRDVMDWFETLGMTSQTQPPPSQIESAPLLTGVRGGYEVDLRRLVAEGGHLLGRLSHASGVEIQLEDTLLADIEAGNEAYRQFVAGLEAMIGQHGAADGEPPAAPEPPGPMPLPAPTRLNLSEAGITSMIWATGYTVDFSWVQCGEYRENGAPVQQRGVSTVPGLYFLGLAFLHTARSSFFWGVGDDAQYIADHLIRRSTP